MKSLRLLQLTSPALPVGAFSYSEGLEWLIQKQKISNESTMFDWLEAELLRGQLRIEAAAQTPIRDALQKWAEFKSIDAEIEVSEWNYWLLALRDAPTVRLQHNQIGRSLIKLLADLGHPLPNHRKDLCWPVAWAWAGLAWHLTKIEVVEGYLYTWVANQLSAAVRLIPLGPTKAQALQSKLLPLISKQAELLLDKDPHQIWTGDIGATFAQMSHSELYSRLFRS